MKPTATGSLALFLAQLIVCTGCTSCTGQAEVHGAPRKKPRVTNQRKHKAPPKGRLGLRARAMPTIARINWNAFPDDRSKEYGSSGRTITLKPGRPGVIARALASAKTGDTFLLHGGTYKEGLDGDHRGLVLIKDGIVIRSLPGQRARIVPRRGVNSGVLIKASHILLHGLHIVGFSSVAISLEKDGGTIKNVILSDIRVEAPTDGKWHDGIVVYTDNRSSKRPASDGLLMRNVTVKNASLGISCNAGPCRSWWLENVTVRGSGGSGSGVDAIAVEEGENMVFYHVDVSDVSADGIDLKARNVLVMGCYVHHLRRNGVKLWHGGDIVNTVIEHTGADAAVVFEHAGHYRILHSVVAYHNYPTPPSYSLTASYDAKEKLKVELVNSIFYKTSGGMYFQDGTKVTVKNCLFHKMKNGTILRTKVGKREVVLNLRGGAKAFEKSGIGSGVVIADPKFVNPSKSDFRLQPKSPAVNRGWQGNATFPPTDVADGPRTRGTDPDIGAHEGH